MAQVVEDSQRVRLTFISTQGSVAVDRREMLKGTILVVGAGAIPAGHAVADGAENLPGYPLATPPPGGCPKAAAPYDPVAVLEAMRDWQLCVRVKDASSFSGSRLLTVDSSQFPDFTSAVRWLHQQAAAADKTFAEKWPVPEDGEVSDG